MHKLIPVEEAKALFSEAKDWSVWRWLMEKGRARRTADAAWEAFDEYEKKVKVFLERRRHEGLAGGRDPGCGECRWPGQTVL